MAWPWWLRWLEAARRGLLVSPKAIADESRASKTQRAARSGSSAFDLVELTRKLREANEEAVMHMLQTHLCDSQLQEALKETIKDEMLRWACSQGSRAVVQQVLATDRSPDWPIDKHGRTPLYIASQQGRTEIVKLLLGMGASANETSLYGWTPLYVASQEGHGQVVQLLIGEGADVNFAEEFGCAVLYTASQQGHVKVVELLLQAGAGVNCVNMDGQTALFVASSRGHSKVVEQLLEAEADLEIAAENGRTPLFIASWGGKAEVVDLLLRAGASANVAAEYGRTPLFVASQRGHVQVVELLLKANANHEARDLKTGQTALHQAKTAAVARCLLKGRADSDASDQHKWSPLHCACASLRNDLVSTLLSWGSSPEMAEGNGYRPLHLVLLDMWQSGCSEDAFRVLQTFVEHGSAWDAACDDIAKGDAKWPYQLGDARPSSTSNARWMKEAPAVRIFVERWTQEQKHSIPLMEVSMEIVRRGVEATEAYIKGHAPSQSVNVHHKIFVVGQSGWGKTSLLESLTTENASPADPDNCTIGVDHFVLEFEERLHELNAVKKHVVTFSDFTGHDAYQNAHMLLFSTGALYMVCIDLESFVVARMQAYLMTDNDSESDSWLNDFIEMKVLKWIRMICARQPDAKFVFVATKKDRVQASDLDDTLTDLQKLMENVAVIVQEKMNSARSSTRLRDAVDEHGNSPLPITYLGDSRLEHMPEKPTVSIMITSCKTTAAMSNFKTAIQGVIKKMDQGVPIPEMSLRVWNELAKMKEMSALLSTDQRLRDTFVNVEELVKRLSHRIGPAAKNEIGDGKESRDDVQFLEEPTCRLILRRLRDLGDVLWYDHIDDELLKNKIILDPMLMIDLVRQIFDHKRTAEIMTHYTLKELDLWKHLEETDGMLSMKRVLQHFQLVYPYQGEMVADSDLIVPAYWQTNTCAFWMFGGGDLRFGKDVHREDVAVRVHWEFQFVNNYPHTLFDHVVVASCSASYKRDVGPGWIMYMDKDKCACRLVLKRALNSHHWMLHLEALQGLTATDKHVRRLWDCFMILATSLEKVIRGYPGVAVTRNAREDTREDVEQIRHSLESLRERPTLPESTCTWMPPQATWDKYQPHFQTHT